VLVQQVAQRPRRLVVVDEHALDEADARTVLADRPLPDLALALEVLQAIAGMGQVLPHRGGLLPRLPELALQVVLALPELLDLPPGGAAVHRRAPAPLLDARVEGQPLLLRPPHALPQAPELALHGLGLPLAPGQHRNQEDEHDRDRPAEERAR